MPTLSLHAQTAMPDDAWPRMDGFVYRGRRLLCEDATLMIPPGFFPRLQAKVCVITRNFITLNHAVGLMAQVYNYFQTARKSQDEPLPTYWNAGIVASIIAGPQWLRSDRPVVFLL